MNLLRQHLIRQITCKTEIIRTGYRMRSQLSRNYVHCANIVSFDFTKNGLSAKRTFSIDSSTTVPPTNSLKQKIMDVFGFSKVRESKAAVRIKSRYLYEAVCDRVNYADFFDRFAMENSFNSWFLVTELHVWMLMVRAMGERDHSELIRNGIVEAMWQDAVLRTKKLAATKRSTINQQIEEISGQFQYAIVAYDEGLMKDDKQLASAVWRRFFNADCDNYEHIELIVKYIRMNIAKIDELNREDYLYKSKIDWVSLSDCNKA